jgi:hypothetical protein
LGKSVSSLVQPLKNEVPRKITNANSAPIRSGKWKRPSSYKKTLSQYKNRALPTLLPSFSAFATFPVMASRLPLDLTGPLSPLFTQKKRQAK